uniref:Double Cache domain-containing protein n=1 Tax=Panagrolaimus superbus TaxID=310955 RepID=A0A914Y3K6_9BILA
MRAENDTYYFNIYDTGYRLLMHPFRKDLVGKDMKDFRTDDGVRIYYDQVEAAKAGGGFVNYRWAKPGSKGDVEKRRLHGRRAEAGAGVHCHHGRLRWRAGTDRAGPELDHRQPHRRTAEAGYGRRRRHRRRQAGQPHRPAAA